jgi:subtilisin family serine protease
MTDMEGKNFMKGAPILKRVLQVLSVVLFLSPTCLTFAEEPKPTAIVPAYDVMESKAAELDYMTQVANTVVAGPHYRLRALDIEPNDYYYDAQWNLRKIEAPAAWDITTGSDEVIIAVIGTGVDLDHPELKNKIWANPGEIPDNGVDDDGNGYVDDVHGWDFANEDNDPQDYHWHGTFVATVTAAETNNGLETTAASRESEEAPVRLKTSPEGSEGAATTVEEPGLPYTVTLMAHPTSLIVGETSVLTATVKDQDNNDVADGMVVTFETSLGSLGSTTVTKTTDSGVATATLTSQVAGTAVVTATSDSKYDTANVTFNPGLPYTVTVEAHPTSIPVRRFTSTITATVKDQYTNPVADGTVVTFTTNLGSLGFDSSSVVETNANGVATTTLESGPLSGTAHVTATADSAVGQTEVIFLWDGGIAGVSWGAKIMPIQFIKRSPEGEWKGSIDDLNEGIKYAADNGARILILDFQLLDYVDMLEATIDYAYTHKGALLVAGAGNCGQKNACGEDLTNPIVYPGAFPHVLAVAATSENDEHLSFSEYHPYVDVAAPGERISGFVLDRYARFPGTDLAAAQVAGLAALIWSVDPTLTNEEVQGIIEYTVVDLGEPGKDIYFGHGRIDASAAVMTAPCYVQVEPESLYFSISNRDDSPSQTITSTRHCTWTTEPTVPWLSINPSEGYTTTVSVDTGGLPGYGVHAATITATRTVTNCVNYPRTIPVTVAYLRRIYLPLLFKSSEAK